IDAAPERLLRVVQMKRLQPIESDETAELRERLRVALRRDDVIAGRVEMARIEADADARMVVHRAEDRRELLERRAERRPLTRRVFEQHHRLAAAPLTQ